MSTIQNWSLTLCALQVLENSEFSGGEDSEGAFSDGEWRPMVREDPVALDGSEGYELPQTTEACGGL